MIAVFAHGAAVACGFADRAAWIAKPQAALSATPRIERVAPLPLARGGQLA